MISGSHTPGAGKVVRHPAAGSGLDGSGDGGGAGAGPPHYRALGVGLRCGRAGGPDIRADRWFPPALDQTQQEELKGAVEQPPAAAGIQLANWYWRVVRQFVLRTVWHQPVPQQLPEMALPAGVCLQAPQEASAQGE